MSKTFAKYHPIVNIAYFFGAIGLSMFISHPLFSFVSLCLSLIYFLVLYKKKSKGVLFWYALSFVLVVLFNGIMNTTGNTVLFIWLKNRPVTFESIFYGVVVGMNFVSVMLWFSCYNIIVTADKFTYLFGKFSPSITLILTMILRLIPELIKKTENIINVRRSIGRGLSNQSFNSKLKNGLETLSILTSCALEDAIVRADSMRSRGYVDNKRTSYQIYTINVCDILVCVVLIITSMIVIATIIMGLTSMKYISVIIYPKISAFTYLGVMSYILFLSVPLIIEVKEKLLCHILKSRI